MYICDICHITRRNGEIIDLLLIETPSVWTTWRIRLAFLIGHVKSARGSESYAPCPAIKRQSARTTIGFKSVRGSSCNQPARCSHRPRKAHLLQRTHSCWLFSCQMRRSFSSHLHGCDIGRAEGTLDSIRRKGQPVYALGKALAETTARPVLCAALKLATVHRTSDDKIVHIVLSADRFDLKALIESDDPIANKVQPLCEIHASCRTTTHDNGDGRGVKGGLRGWGHDLCAPWNYWLKSKVHSTGGYSDDSRCRTTSVGRDRKEAVTRQREIRTSSTAQRCNTCTAHGESRNRQRVRSITRAIRTGFRNFDCINQKAYAAAFAPHTSRNSYLLQDSTVGFPWICVTCVEMTRVSRRFRKALGS